ncbi:MAG TPA: sigma 54-interacting transcriptional regulator [Terriglobales bacterium]|nr:sigma 54-interacting transcriptional regulator [Terriglobales bacterium]
MNPRLVGVHGPLKAASLALVEGEVSVGRDSSNPLWTSDPALSRRHCTITGQDGRFTIRDLNSLNGTRVNGVRVEQHELSHGDQIVVGDSVLVFLSAEDDFHLEKSAVELTETGELRSAPFLLRPEDAAYGLPGVTPAALPQTPRIASDLNFLLTVATGIGSIRDREALEWQLLGMIFDVVPADRGAILHFVPGTEQSESAIAWDRKAGPGKPVPLSRTVVRRVVAERAGLLVRDVAADTNFRAVATVNEFESQSLLCVPLMRAGEVIGVIYLDSRNPGKLFDQDHLQVMTAVAGIASLALENVRQWESLKEENQLLREEINLEHNMVGASPRMQQVFEVIRRVAPTDSTVLIQGESGTGKELVARAIHHNSPRAQRPLVAVNCAALTETLLESELFGHERGAFTGAIAQKKGKIEAAQGGTLFLDEVTEMAVELQPKLLRVLQEREFERVGGTRPIKADIRLVAATNRDLQEAVESGKFRKDLYYRLNVVAVTMPSLRERREDIPALAEHFIVKAGRRAQGRAKALSPEARACLMNYDWPGNVRELENALERAVVLSTGEVILIDDLPEVLLESAAPACAPAAKYHGSVRDSKKQLVVQALQQANGNYIEAAQILGLHPNSLLRLIRNLGLKPVAKIIGEGAR